MSLERVFLDWQGPILPAAAEYLIDRFTQGGMIDCRQAIVVLPGKEAGRRLQQLLLERADAQGLVFLPPSIFTATQLPEQLYKPQQPAASDFTQLFVWAEVLRQTPTAELAPLIPQPPRAEATARWLDLARLLKSQHEKLAGEGFGFDDVAGCAIVKELPEEESRWQLMHALQARYLARIDGLGYWDRQTARRVAIDKHECQTEDEIVLIGTVDLPRVLRNMLDQVAGSVTALVHAPASLAERFDEHGCVLPSAWLKAELPMDDSQIMRVGGANEQAAAVARELARLEGRYRADQITVGIPDESLAPSIDRKLRQHGLSTRFVGGRTLASSGPVQLLLAVAAYLTARDFPSFAALVRHPDLFTWLMRCIDHSPPEPPAASASESSTTESSPAETSPNKPLDLLAQLDNYYNDRLPSDFDLSRVEIIRYPVVASICNLTKSLIEPLMTAPAAPARWIAPLRELLTKVYGQAELHSDDPTDRPTRDAFNNLARSFEQLDAIPSEIVPPLSATDTISLLLNKISTVNVPPPRDPAAIEMLGWLELPQDDAPVLIVTSYNEGRVPSFVDADLFLPEPICRELGVDDNDRRYARDAYTTSVLLHAREQVQFIVARRNVAGDPLTPSRLLFAADRETVARRARRIFSEENETLPASIPPVPLPATSMLPVPPAEPEAEQRERFSVSSFKSYLECPYRFYLRHVLKLVELSDEAQELEANHFGSLLHDVLDDFGRDENIRTADKPDHIFAYLSEKLDERAQQKFLSRNRGAIAVQLEQLRRRLEHFAQWQAERVQGGWVIEYVEKTLEADWEVDGQPVTLHGRVDRIDLHTATGQAAVFDYKSGDSAKDPEKAHRKGKEQWIDLQLPLYRHLAHSAGIEGEVELGYIALPKDVSKIGHLPATWSASELAEADEAAREVIRAVRDNQFEPMSHEVKPQWDIFAAICHSRSLGQRPPADTEDDD